MDTPSEIYSALKDCILYSIASLLNKMGAFSNLARKALKGFASSAVLNAVKNQRRERDSTTDNFLVVTRKFPRSRLAASPAGSASAPPFSSLLSTELKQKRPQQCGLFCFNAERARFELAVPIKERRFSKPLV